jgi:hypothetical protein
MFSNKDMLQVQIDHEKLPKKINDVEHYYLIIQHHLILTSYYDATNEFFIK